MAATDKKSEDEKPKMHVLEIIAIVSVVVLILSVVVPYFRQQKNGRHHNILWCTGNLHQLSLTFKIYADNNDDRYPTPDKWCDLIKEYGALEGVFVCPAKKHTGQRCSYAINPNAEPNSPYDTVLLFETKGGWNQFGGPELLTTENHRRRGCSVLFAALWTAFIEPDELGKLKWKADANDG